MFLSFLKPSAQHDYSVSFTDDGEDSRNGDDDAISWIPLS